ncbi:hypothetical protein WKH56_19610 [Priestia sp. SB1]|uniref:hypothetical protein n=1 Tax=Priestia sp. SB1 TaxID=3132359 RepID=UPI003173563D
MRIMKKVDGEWIHAKYEDLRGTKYFVTREDLPYAKVFLDGEWVKLESLLKKEND